MSVLFPIQTVLEAAKKKFIELLAKHNISEDEQDVESGIKERIHKISNKVINQYCDKNEVLGADFGEKFLKAVELKIHRCLTGRI